MLCSVKCGIPPWNVDGRAVEGFIIIFTIIAWSFCYITLVSLLVVARFSLNSTKFYTNLDPPHLHISCSVLCRAKIVDKFVRQGKSLIFSLDRTICMIYDIRFVAKVKKKIQKTDRRSSVKVKQRCQIWPPMGQFVTKWNKCSSQNEQKTDLKKSQICPVRLGLIAIWAKWMWNLT